MASPVPFWDRKFVDARPLDAIKGPVTVRSKFQQFNAWYQMKYIRTNSFSPLIHTMIVSGTFCYWMTYNARGKYHKRYLNH